MARASSEDEVQEAVVDEVHAGLGLLASDSTPLDKDEQESPPDEQLIQQPPHQHRQHAEKEPEKRAKGEKERGVEPQHHRWQDTQVQVPFMPGSGLETSEESRLVEIALEIENEALEGSDDVKGRDEAAEGDHFGECWICKDSTSERLIQPCACRGSMDGVHASCLQEWIRHYRRNAENMDHPRCSVCHQPYLGVEVRPGAGRLAKEVAGHSLYLAVRWAVQLCVLHVYIEALRTRTSQTQPPSVRWAAVAVAALVLAYKVLVITVSLPNGNPQRLLSIERLVGAPPRSRLLRRCYATSLGLRLHLAEIVMLLMVLSLGLLVGNMPAYSVLPAYAVMVMPLGKVFIGNSSEARQRAASCLYQSLCACLASPCLLARSAASTVHEALHALDAGPHILLPFVAMGLTLCGPSTSALQKYLIAHTSLALSAIAERCFFGLLQWRNGRGWLLAMQVVWMTWSLVNSRYMAFPADQLQMLLLSTVWGISLLALGICVNWAFCLEWFRSWQTRRGVFLLQGSLLATEDARQANEVGANEPTSRAGNQILLAPEGSLEEVA